MPFTLIVPVVESTALSMKLMRPVDGLPLSVGAIALAGSVPCAAMKRLSAGSCPSGTEKETYTGVTLLIVTIVWVSCARTRLPGWTCSKPVRPDIGAMIVAYVSCTFAVSTFARSAATVASSAAAWVRMVSTCSRVAMPRSRRSW